jgi:hypothetical protein
MLATSKVHMPQVQEASIMQAQEAPMIQMLDGSGATDLQGGPARVGPGADDAPLGAISIGADGADPRLGNFARNLHHDLLKWGTDSGMPGHTTPGDMVPALGFSGVVGPAVAGLL